MILYFFSLFQFPKEISMETIKDKVKKYFTENNVTYEEIYHQPAGSAEEYHKTLGTRYEQQAKALFVRYKKPGEKGFIIVALPAQKQADLSKICTATQSKEVRLADAVQLKEVTGCNFGELPPLGKIFGLKLLMDRDLLKEDKIYFNAGDLSYSIAISAQVIEQLEQPTLLDF
jgi:Ala-tRNA(Pro) deacylase